MKLPLLISALVLSLTLSAQQPSLTWNKHAGDAQVQYAKVSATDQDNNYILAGNFFGSIDFTPGPNSSELVSLGLDDMFITKFSAGGVHVWTKQIGGTGQETVCGIATDEMGNIYLTGIGNGAVDYDPGPDVVELSTAGSMDAFILKLNPDGEFLWVKYIGGSSLDQGRAIDIQGNDLVVAGNFDDIADLDPGSGDFSVTSEGYFDSYVVKLDLDGNFVWGGAFHGEGEGYVHSLVLDDDGNVIVAGIFSGSVDMDPGASGQFLNAVNDYNWYVTKLDADGGYVWAQLFGLLFYQDETCSIDCDADGNVYFNASTYGDFEYTINNQPFLLEGENGQDAILVKISAAGDVLWAINYGGDTTTFNISRDIGLDVCVKSSNEVLVSGMHSQYADFDPGSGVVNLSGGSFVASYSASGTYNWAMRTSGSIYRFYAPLVMDQQGGIYVAGSFLGSPDVDPGAGTLEISSAGQEDVYITKFAGSPASAVVSNEKEFHAMLYPSPSNKTVNLQIPSEMIGASLRIVNSYGQTMAVQMLNSELSAIDCSTWAQGVYLASVERNGVTSQHTFVVEH